MRNSRQNNCVRRKPSWHPLPGTCLPPGTTRLSGQRTGATSAAQCRRVYSARPHCLIFIPAQGAAWFRRRSRPSPRAARQLPCFPFHGPVLQPSKPCASSGSTQPPAMLYLGPAAGCATLGPSRRLCYIRAPASSCAMLTASRRLRHTLGAGDPGPHRARGLLDPARVSEERGAAGPGRVSGGQAALEAGPVLERDLGRNKRRRELGVGGGESLHGFLPRRGDLGHPIGLPRPETSSHASCLLCRSLLLSSAAHLC